MNGNHKEKTLFKSHYCLGCKQTKLCGVLTQNTNWKDYCCECYFHWKQEESQEYSNYQKVYQRKSQEKQAQVHQLLLLRNYLGCSQCGSLRVDAYELYENSKLACQLCLMKKEGGASGAVSFSEQQKWFKKYWGIDLNEWLTNFKTLPMNSNCAKKWLADNNHLKNCRCLEQETQELHELFTNSLKRSQELLKKCRCKTSKKPRTPYYDIANYGYTYCEKCEIRIKGAGKHGVIKNRNNSDFWGLECKEKVLCLACLGELREKMPQSKKYTFNKYVRRYNLKTG